MFFYIHHVFLPLSVIATKGMPSINPLNAELNPIRHLLALVGARHIVHVSRIRVKGKNGRCSRHIIETNFRSSFMEVRKNKGEGRRKYYKQRQNKQKKDKVGISERYKA